MKRWFCGFLSGTDSTLTTFPKPLDGKIIWEGANHVWMCGSWQQQQLTTIYEGSVRLIIVGTCLAPDETLVELFQKAIKRNEYSQLMSMPGNYNLIVQDKTDTYIFVDVAGLKPVFYTKYDSLIVYSSLGVALQQLIKAEIDSSWLASSLTGLTTLNLPQNRSPFCNVQVIPPGHYLQISSGKLTCKRYWNVPQTYSNFTEAAENLRQQLLTAVEGRVHLYSNITSDLSGGFDSTSLALIAAKNLAMQERNLHAITIKTAAATKSEDLKWAQHAASLYPNIASVMIENDEILGEFSNLELIPLTDAPDSSMLSIGEMSHVMGIIKSKGSQLHMSGEGGDAVLSFPPSYLADLLRRAQFKTFVQQSYGKSRVGYLSPLALISGAIKLSLTTYPQWLLQQAKKLMTGQRLSQSFVSQESVSEMMGWDSTPNVASWYTKKSVDLVVAELQNWATVATSFTNFPGQNDYIAKIQSLGFGCRVQQQLAETYDVNLEFPFLDALVIDACLCAKPEDMTNPFTYKPLLSKALEHEIPKSVFTRNTKGDYTVDEIVALQQNLLVIKELFQTSLLADMGLIDIRKLDAYMTQLSMGLAAGEWHFHQTLATELWLRRVVDAGNSFWI